MKTVTIPISVTKDSQGYKPAFGLARGGRGGGTGGILGMF